MWAAINVASNFTGMFLWVARSGHYPNPTSIPRFMRTPDYSPNVGTGPRLRHPPAMPLSMPNRFAYVFVRVISHFHAILYLHRMRQNYTMNRIMCQTGTFARSPLASANPENRPRVQDRSEQLIQNVKAHAASKDEGCVTRTLQPTCYPYDCSTVT